MPHSVIKIWLLKTNIDYNKRKYNKYFDNGGYCSISEVYSDMSSWYDFFTVERYVQNT